MRNLTVLATAVAVLSMTAGCASLGTTANVAYEKLAVEYATIKAVKTAKTPAARQAMQAKIIAIATQAQTVLASPSVTLALVQTAVNTQIAKQHLAAEDQMVADALVQMVSDELTAKVGAGVLKPSDVVSVNTVLSWVVAGASFPVG